MKKVLIFLISVVIILSFVLASEFTPQGDINLRNIYNITNGVWINGTDFNASGLYFGNGSQLTDIVVSTVNSSDFWDNLDTPNQITSLTGITVINSTLWTNVTITESQISNLQTYIVNNSVGWVANFTEIFSLDWTNVTITESQISDFQSYILTSNEGNLNVNSSDFWDGLDTPVQITGLNSTNINDIYLFNTGDTATGNYIFSNNITANFFFGIFDWIIGPGISTDYLSFNGTDLLFVESKLNTTIDSIVLTNNASVNNLITQNNQSMNNFIIDNNNSVNNFINDNNVSVNNFVNDVTILADGTNALTANWNAGLFNITADFFFGNGSQLTDVASSTANSSDFWDNLDDPTDITGLVDSQISDTLTISGAGSVVWAALNTYPSTCTSSQFISVLGDTLTCAAISITASQVSDFVSEVNTVIGNFFDQDLNTTSNVVFRNVTVNNITADFYFGDGSQLTGIGGGTVTSVSAGNGLDFTTITSTGAVTMGTPGSLTASTTNAVTATSHTHAVSGFLENLVEDTTPQLGGFLDANGQNIGSTTDEIENIYIGDDTKIFFGDGQDASIFWNGTALLIG